jgi:hypothetical protein
VKKSNCKRAQPSNNTRSRCACSQRSLARVSRGRAAASRRRALPPRPPSGLDPHATEPCPARSARAASAVGPTSGDRRSPACQWSHEKGASPARTRRRSPAAGFARGRRSTHAMELTRPSCGCWSLFATPNCGIRLWLTGSSSAAGLARSLPLLSELIRGHYVTQMGHAAFVMGP